METEPHRSTAQKLIAMSVEEEEMRSIAGLDRAKWDDSVDARNTARLKEIVDEMGWPTVSKVGEEASHAAWLLTQHAYHDPDLMKRCLELMKQAPEGEVQPRDIAYLEDRLLTMEDRPQIYGTQFCRVDNEWQPLPIEDPEHVEERRASVGIGPIAGYIQQLKEMYGD
jgi:hypothetical protein